MAKTATGKIPVSAEEFKLLLKEEEKSLAALAGDYHDACRTISALDANFHHIYNTRSVGNHRLITLDRFPVLDTFTPDACYEWDNGYGLLWELKKVFHEESKEDILKQLGNYSQCDSSAISELCRDHDVALLVGFGSGEKAVTYLTSKSPVDVSEFVVIEYSYEGRRVNGEAIQMVRNGYFGHNGSFAINNADVEGGDGDLNLLFAASEPQTFRCDEDAIKGFGACPFINDEPPPIYTVSFPLPQILAAMFSPGEQDIISTNGVVNLKFTLAQVIAASASLFPNLPPVKATRFFRNALVDATKAGLFVADLKTDPIEYSIKLSKDIPQLGIRETSRKLAKLAVGDKYLVNKARYSPEQPVLDFGT